MVLLDEVAGLAGRCCDSWQPVGRTDLFVVLLLFIQNATGHRSSRDTQYPKPVKKRQFLTEKDKQVNK